MILLDQYRALMPLDIVQVKIWTSHTDASGKDPANKSDEFLEKFQTAFEPPPLIFGKLYCLYCKFFIMDMVAYMQEGMRAR